MLSLFVVPWDHLGSFVSWKKLGTCVLGWEWTSEKHPEGTVPSQLRDVPCCSLAISFSLIVGKRDDTVGMITLGEIYRKLIRPYTETTQSQNTAAEPLHTEVTFTVSNSRSPNGILISSSRFRITSLHKLPARSKVPLRRPFGWTQRFRLLIIAFAKGRLDPFSPA